MKIMFNNRARLRDLKDFLINVNDFEAKRCLVGFTAPKTENRLIL